MKMYLPHLKPVSYTHLDVYKRQLLYIPIYCGIITTVLNNNTIYTKGGVPMANKKQTSSKVASTASKILTDGRYSKASKSVAGSALSQAKKK